MPPIILKINNFFGGISDDPRKPSTSEFQRTKHFDIFSQPNKLIPYRSLEADTETSVSATDLKQYLVRDFLYASASAKLWGLGQTSGGLTKILQKADASSGLWTTPSSSEGNGAVKNGCFVEFTDYAWGFQGTNQIWKWGLLSGTPSITNSVTTVASTITSVAQGVIASDANLYLPYNNTLVRIAAETLTPTDEAISVPTNFKITSVANYGNDLAIGCAPISSFNGVSKVFIWNLSSDKFKEVINFGEGDLRILDLIEGILVGVSDRYLNNSIGAGFGSMIIQIYAGGSPQVVKEIFTKALTNKTMPITKAVKANRLFWSAKIMTNSAGTEYDEGIWSFGRKNLNYPYTLALDIIDENVDTDGIEAFGLAGNYFYVAHSNDGSVDKTNDSAVFAFTSVYDSQILNFGDSDLLKRLDKVSLTTSPLISGASVTVKYKIDSETSFTTIGSFSTLNGISRDFLQIDSSELNFPSFKEITFSLESTGGAEITGFEIEVTPLQGSVI